jgi:hypothetical protein
VMMRLLRAPHIGIFPRSFRLHGAHHAREMIVEICSMWDALATAIITRTGSWWPTRFAYSKAAATSGTGAGADLVPPILRSMRYINARETRVVPTRT